MFTILVNIIDNVIDTVLQIMYYLSLVSIMGSKCLGLSLGVIIYFPHYILKHIVTTT